MRSIGRPRRAGDLPRRWLACACLLLGAVLPMSMQAAPQPNPQPANSQDRRIAITIDDLPWQRIGVTPAGALQPRHRQLIEQLRKADAPIIGFVNEGKLEVDGEVQPERLAMLRDWLEAGFELGNHTYGHVDLHEVGIKEYEADIVRGERQLRPLLAERGMVPRWFRHPYLRAGQTQDDKAVIGRFLGEHGYRVAPVTVDNGEWVWNFAYENVLDGQADTPQRTATLARLRDGYIPYMLAKVDYYEGQSRALLGYALPQVWLMHANTINAVAFADLVDGVRKRGYRTITLDEATKDPAYQREDGYTGRYGPSWLHRWAMAEHKPNEFYAGEPQVPRWVLDLAGLESE